MGKAGLPGTQRAVSQLCFFSQTAEIHPKAWLNKTIHLKINTILESIFPYAQTSSCNVQRIICSWGKLLSNSYRLVFSPLTMAATCKLKRPWNSLIEFIRWLKMYQKVSVPRSFEWGQSLLALVGLAFESDDSKHGCGHYSPPLFCSVQLDTQHCKYLFIFSSYYLSANRSHFLTGQSRTVFLLPYS